MSPRQANRCADGLCGACRACHTRAAWERGCYDRGRRAPRHDAWTPDEEDRLRALAGTLPSAELAATIGRTRGAVRNRASRLGLSLDTEDWSLNRLAALFGAHWATIRDRWLEAGLLAGWRTPPGMGSPFGEWHVVRSDLEAFIREKPWAYDVERMQPRHPLTRLAEQVQRRDPWLYSDAVMAHLGISQAAFSRLVVAGVIPHQRRRVGRPGGQESGVLVVRASDLAGLRARLAERKRANILARNRRTGLLRAAKRRQVRALLDAAALYEPGDRLAA